MRCQRRSDRREFLVLLLRRQWFMVGFRDLLSDNGKWCRNICWPAIGQSIPLAIAPSFAVDLGILQMSRSILNMRAVDGSLCRAGKSRLLD